MENPVAYIRPLLIVLLLAAPAVSVRIASHFSDDPYLQPLDITEEGLAAIGDDGGAYGMARIDVRVDWGENRSDGLSRAHLERQLVNVLEGQTDLYRLDFHDVPGDAIGVTFVVGSNSYGPFPPARMVDGLASALIALRMSNRPRSRPDSG